MSSSTYRLEDEPLPTPWQKWAVSPLFPLLGLMFGGAWLAWPWFLVNGQAMGSPTRPREWRLALGALLGSVVLAGLIVRLEQVGVLDLFAFKLGVLVIQIWKLAFGYALQMTQQRSFALFEHYQGRPRDGVALIAAAFLVRGYLLDAVPLWVVLVLA